MAVYVIGDTHLSGISDKSMDIFGERWKDYTKKLIKSWENTVRGGDTVIIAGDVSWGINLQESSEDFRTLNSLPGMKILLKGNHDYWWTSVTKLNAFVDANRFTDITFLYNNAYAVEKFVICGTRGWISPGDKKFGKDDFKIYQRELGRFDLSVSAAQGIGSGKKELLAFMHFPPLGINGERTHFTEKIAAAGIKRCFFGHIHNENDGYKYNVSLDGVEYRLISADFLKFKPLRID